MRNIITALVAAAFLFAGAGVAIAFAWDASISGAVVNVSTNDPVAGVKVTAFVAGTAKPQASAITDAKGQFSLQGLEGGTYHLFFDKKGYQRTAVGGVEVRPHERHIESAKIAVYPNGVPIPKNVSNAHPCGSLVQPGQTASVYVICGNSR